MQTHAEVLTAITDTDIQQIEYLLSTLSERFADISIDHHLLRDIISSPSHDLLIVRQQDTDMIIGIATVNITLGPGAGRGVYLEDFVVSPDFRGQGIGTILWNGILNWCQAHDARLFFTSRKKDAINFYLNKGAVIKETTVLTLKP
jgi:GNAT superfamily N-acetyltransferase